MTTYVKPAIVSVVSASKAIAIGLNGSDPLTKMGALQDNVDHAIVRSTTGAYPADE